MLIFYCLVNLYLVIFFSLMALVGVGYLVSYVIRRMRSRKLTPQSVPPGGVRRAYTENALKAA
jgi:hypothetical protein